MLISHDSDLMAPGDMPDVLPNPYLVKWYCVGLTDRVNDKFGNVIVEPVPYGMNAFINGGALALYLHERMQSKAWLQKTKFDEARLDRGQAFVLFNCAIDSNRKDRTLIRHHFCSNTSAFPAVHCDAKKRDVTGDKDAWFEFYDDITRKYKFWIAPPGNCNGRKFCGAGHRVFEAASLGMVPIWQHDPFMDEIFPPDFPILKVSDWNQITNDYLVEMARGNFSNKALLYNWPVRNTLNPAYWQDRILGFREQWLRKQGIHQEKFPTHRCWGRESPLPFVVTDFS